MTARLRSRAARGAAELFGVLALAALATFVLTAWTLAERRSQEIAARETTGHVAAAWLQAMHRATMESDYSAVVAGGGAVVTPASLAGQGHAPPGLPAAPRGATMTLGVIGDGTAQATAMAFLVVTPASLDASHHIHRGLVDAGIENVEFAAGPAGAMAGHRAAIEALTGALASEAFFITADTLVHVPGALYRRPQPGRPWLNDMAGDLALDGNDIVDAGAILAGAIDHLDPAIDPLVASTWPGVRTTSTSVVSTAAVVADPASLVPGTTALDPARTPPGAGAASLAASSTATFASLDTAGIEAASGLDVTADLVVGSLVTPAAIRSASATVTNALQAAGLQAATLTAQATTVGAAATVSGTLATPSATVARIGGAPVVDTATIAATGGVYGPSLRVVGRLTAGSCSGC
ncbi:MAG: hypothetical protein OXK73_03360 [Rhodospirillaceae bacterium]|nr:hypothetical protein [Rhodospirillaceae bacterium]